MEQIRVITTATVLTVRYSVEDAQEESEVEYEVEATDVVGQDVAGSSVKLQIWSPISRTVFEDVRDEIEDGEMDVTGLMVPEYLLPAYINNYADELEVYPL